MFTTQLSQTRAKQQLTTSLAFVVRLAAVSIVVLSPLQVVHGETSVSPSALANSEGNVKSDSWPPVSRGMSIYGSSVFDSIEGPVRITHLNFRPNGGLSVGSKFGFDHLKLLYSVTLVEPPSMSGAFEANLANVVTEPKVIFDDAWSSEVVNEDPLGPATRPFDFEIELNPPIEFNPADGNLLVDWLFGAPIAMQSAFDRDERVFTDHRTIWANGSNPSNAVGIFSVPVQFTFASVPEPTFGWNSFVVACGFVSLMRRRRVAGNVGRRKHFTRTYCESI